MKLASIEAIVKVLDDRKVQSMKEAVARPKDLDDVWHLKKLKEADSNAR